MKVVNTKGLHDAIYRAVCNDPYDKGDADYSVTGLLKPPRIVALERKHKDEITEEAVDRVWSLLGSAVHTILERANVEGVVERRLKMEVLGKVVSGSMDSYHPGLGLLSDYKVTSVYKVLKGCPVEWEQQLNIYAALLRHYGDPVNKLQIIAILRDWSKIEAAGDSFYPQIQVQVIDVPMWTDEQALDFVANRIAEHEAAKKKLPLCTPEQRWAAETKFAVMKAGAQRATKLFAEGDYTQAEALAKQLGGGAKVVKREGVSKRCAFYCSVAPFCKQWQDLKGGGK